MVSTRFWLAILLALPLLSGCDAVVTHQPMGAEVVNLDEATWQGTWLGVEIVILTTVIDAEKGLLEAAWVERGPEGARFETVTGTVRRTGEWTFLNMEQEQFEESDPAKEKGGAPAASAPDQTAMPVEYVWARVDNDGQRILLWWPDVDQVRAAVSAGTLPGQIKDDDDVLLGTLTAEQLEAINTPQNNLLKWSEPVSLTRVNQ